MSVSINEALHNAEFNLDNIRSLGTMVLPLIKEQLYNARVLLEKGYSMHDEVEPLIEKYGSVENVPSKEDE